MSAREGKISEQDCGYYLNSLRSWKAERQKEHRMLMARYARLEGTHSPILRSQGKLIDFNGRFLKMISEEIAKYSGDGK